MPHGRCLDVILFSFPFLTFPFVTREQQTGEDSLQRVILCEFPQEHIGEDRAESESFKFCTADPSSAPLPTIHILESPLEY